MSSTCHVYLHIQRIGPCFYGSYGLSAVEKFTFDDRCIVCNTAFQFLNSIAKLTASRGGEEYNLLSREIIFL